MPEGPLERTTALIEDVEFMLDTGAGWDEICRRANRSPDALERLLERNNHYDLVVRARARDTRSFA